MWGKDRFLGGPTFAERLIRNREALLDNATTSANRATRGMALDVYEAALAAVDPSRAVQGHLRMEGDRLSANGLEFALGGGGAVRLLAFGKAGLRMAQAALEVVPPEEGLVIVPEAQGPVGNIRVVEAGHPIPDAGSLQGGELAMGMAGRCGPHDVLLVLVSGGGSSLVEATDLPLDVLQEASTLLLRSGMDIERMNTVRSHLSNLKGGQLGAAAARRGGRVLTMAISDVVGDPPNFIASGPTVGDPTTFADARDALQAYDLWEVFPDEARRRIEEGLAGRREETPDPKDPRLSRAAFLLVGSNAVACAAAREEAVRRGYQTAILTSHLRGEARDAGRALASMAEAVNLSPPAARRLAFITGGETTVRVRGEGVGGRCQEFALAAAPVLHGQKAVLLSCGTDGHDGETDAAGALVDGGTLARAARLGLDVMDHLSRNDSHSFFRALGDTVETGVTGTNVMDLQILLVDRT